MQEAVVKSQYKCDTLLQEPYDSCGNVWLRSNVLLDTRNTSSLVTIVHPVAGISLCREVVHAPGRIIRNR